MQPTLLILAAGMASRYGSLKQMEGFGPSGETIMEYSIFDAIRAGFKKVVFIIRKDFAQDFQEIFEPKLKGKIEVGYVFQELKAFTEGYDIPEDRTKPWGTAHAVLCAKEMVQDPFAVINADDFYGRDAFEKAYEFLVGAVNSKTYAIIGYDLQKTLSAHGTVNRGVCRVDENEHLISIAERLNISQEGDHVKCDDGQEPVTLPLHSAVSMNFWCFDASIFDYSQLLFGAFLKEHGQTPKSEFFITYVADQFIQERGAVRVIPTTAQWFGVTYKEDAPSVKKSLDTLIAAGAYPQNLWQS